MFLVYIQMYQIHVDKNNNIHTTVIIEQYL